MTNPAGAKTAADKTHSNRDEDRRAATPPRSKVVNLRSNKVKERQATRQAIKRPPTTPRAGKAHSAVPAPSLALELKAINRATAHRAPLARVPDREARASQPAATRAAAVQIPRGAIRRPAVHRVRNTQTAVPRRDPVRLTTRTWNTRGNRRNSPWSISKTNWPRRSPTSDCSTAWGGLRKISRNLLIAGSR